MFSKNYSFRSPKDIVIKVGNADKSKLYKEYKAENLIINGCYTTSENNDDIALIKSESVIVMEDSDNEEPIVGSVCLPNKDSDPVRTDAIITGWGVWDEKEFIKHFTKGKHNYYFRKDLSNSLSIQ